MPTRRPEEPPRHGRAPVLGPPSFAGILPALLVGCVSLTPSLMPRSATFQGIVTGISAAFAYAVGVGLAGMVGRRRRRAEDRDDHRTGRSLRVLRVLAVGATVAALGFLLWKWLAWQRDLHELVGAEAPPRWAPAVVVVVAAVVLFVLVTACRALRGAGRVLGTPLRLVVPAALATLIGALLLVALLATATDRFITDSALAAIDQSFDSANNGTPEGAQRPTTRLRSGGPGALSPWDELGMEGRAFVGRGPTVEDLEAVADGEVVEPVRVYGGLDSTEDLDELAELVVSELDRTGGFERSVLCVAIPTGRGWVNPQAAEALELLHGGDTAIASMQYSYLPSPLAFLVDPERAKDAGASLFAAVRDRWEELPEASRPRLVVYGESLGSTGAQAAFTGLADLRDRADAALFVGPPESNTLWRQLVERRDPGTSETLPTYDGGTTARFASTPEDLQRPAGEWGDARVLFLQNATDPIVWWSTRLAWQRPDWLRESTTQDLSGPIRWFPMVSFLQVSADMVVANDAPAGHGHRYGDFIDYWAALVPPGGWTPADTDRLDAAVD